MVDCIKYDMPEMKDGRWLRDLAEIIRPASDVYYTQFMEDADDDIKSDPQEFRRVARKLHDRFEPPKDGRTRGGAFHIHFGSTEEDSDANHTMQKEINEATPRGSKGRKRSGTKSIAESRDRKKATLECPACGMRGHDLPDCWCVFKELKPEGMTASAYRIRKAKKAIAEDDELRAEVEEIRQTMDD